MAVYWLLFLLPAVALFLPQRLTAGGNKLAWAMYALVFVLFIGFRHEVGGDWAHYEGHFDRIARMDLLGALEFGDPGYYGISWLVSHLGGDIHVLNAICAAAVMAGVIVFARAQPLPWLAFVVAVPYLIIVVAMGYTRQSAALGLAMIGLTALGRQHVRQFVVWVLIAALFHKSAVLLLPIAALATSRRRLWTWIWVGITTAVGATLLLLDDSDTLWQNYVEADYQSQGGFIRILMNAVPAILFLLFRRRLQVREAEQQLWFWLSVFSLVCIPLVVLSSTATDRVALYFIPIQMYVFAHLHRLALTAQGRTSIVVAVVVYCAAVLYVWTHYATHAQYWVPYHFMPL
jgi:hypothetical protein